MKRYKKLFHYRIVCEADEPYDGVIYGANFYVREFDLFDKEWFNLIEGHVKWDGCVDWNSDIACRLHHCDYNGIRELMFCIENAYFLAAEMIDGFAGKMRSE